MCICDSSSLLGFFIGTACEACQAGYGGGDCRLPCNSAASTTVGTSCKCITGFGGPSCSVKCPGLSAVCSGHGSCFDGSSGNGTCACAKDYYGPDCSVFCTTALCRAAGLANPQCNVTTGACECQRNQEGMWAGDSCDACVTGFTGMYCSGVCNCNNHGGCNQYNGACTCFTDPLNGFWGGQDCSTCLSGYIGANCQSLNVGLSISAANSASTKIASKETTTPSIFFFDTITGIRYVGANPVAGFRRAQLERVISGFNSSAMYLGVFNSSHLYLTTVNKANSGQYLLSRLPLADNASNWNDSLAEVDVFGPADDTANTLGPSQQQQQQERRYALNEAHPKRKKRRAAGALDEQPSSGDMKAASRGPVTVVAGGRQAATVSFRKEHVAVFSFDFHQIIDVLSVTVGENGDVAIAGRSVNRSWKALIVTNVTLSRGRSPIATLLDAVAVPVPECAQGDGCQNATRCERALPSFARGEADLWMCTLTSTTKSFVAAIAVNSNVSSNSSFYDSFPAASIASSASRLLFSLELLGYPSSESTGLACAVGPELCFISLVANDISYLIKVNVELEVVSGTTIIPSAGLVRSLVVAEEALTVTTVSISDTQIDIISLNYFGVSLVTPNVVDASGGTVVTVTGEAFPRNLNLSSGGAPVTCVFEDGKESVAVVSSGVMLTCVAPEVVPSQACSVRQFNLRISQEQTASQDLSVLRPASALLAKVITSEGNAGYGSMLTSSVLTIAGSGFVPSQWQRLVLVADPNTPSARRIELTNVTFLSTYGMRCIQPAMALPTRPGSYIIYSHDGQVFGSSRLPYVVAGVAAGLKWRPPNVSSIRSEFTSLIPVMVIEVVDSLGNPLKRTLTGALTITASLVSDTYAFHPLTVLRTSTQEGEASFDRMFLMLPQVGTVVLSFTSLGATAVGSIMVVPGDPSQLLLQRYSLEEWRIGVVAAMTLRPPPRVFVADVSGNQVLDRSLLPETVVISYVYNVPDGNLDPVLTQATQSGVLDETQTYNFATVSVQNTYGTSVQLQFSVPELYTLFHLESLRLSLTEFELCAENEYAPPLGFVCLPCPAYGICDGTSTVVVSSGAWRASFRSYVFYSCAAPIGTDSCSYGGVCDGGFTGPLCSVCEPGYGKTATKCQKCPPSSVANVFLAMLLIMVVFLVAIFVANALFAGLVTSRVATGRKSVLTIVLKIIFSHLQMIATVVSVSTLIPPYVKAVMSAGGQVTNVGSISILECTLAPNFYANFTMIMTAAPILVLIFSVAMLVFAVVKVYHDVKSEKMRIIEEEEEAARNKYRGETVNIDDILIDADDDLFGRSFKEFDTNSLQSAQTAEADECNNSRPSSEQQQDAGSDSDSLGKGSSIAAFGQRQLQRSPGGSLTSKPATISPTSSFAQSPGGGLLRRSSMTLRRSSHAGSVHSRGTSLSPSDSEASSSSSSAFLRAALASSPSDNPSASEDRCSSSSRESSPVSSEADRTDVSSSHFGADGSVATVELGDVAIAAGASGAVSSGTSDGLATTPNPLLPLSAQHSFLQMQGGTANPLVYTPPPSTASPQLVDFIARANSMSLSLSPSAGNIPLGSPASTTAGAAGGSFSRRHRTVSLILDEGPAVPSLAAAAPRSSSLVFSPSPSSAVFRNSPPATGLLGDDDEKEIAAERSKSKHRHRSSTGDRPKPTNLKKAATAMMYGVSLVSSASRRDKPHKRRNRKHEGTRSLDDDGGGEVEQCQDENYAAERRRQLLEQRATLQKRDSMRERTGSILTSSLLLSAKTPSGLSDEEEGLKGGKVKKTPLVQWSDLGQALDMEAVDSPSASFLSRGSAASTSAVVAAFDGSECEDSEIFGSPEAEQAAARRSSMVAKNATRKSTDVPPPSSPDHHARARISSVAVKVLDADNGNEDQFAKEQSVALQSSVVVKNEHKRTLTNRMLVLDAEDKDFDEFDELETEQAFSPRSSIVSKSALALSPSSPKQQLRARASSVAVKVMGSVRGEEDFVKEQSVELQSSVVFKNASAASSTPRKSSFALLSETKGSRQNLAGTLGSPQKATKVVLGGGVAVRSGSQRRGAPSLSSVYSSVPLAPPMKTRDQEPLQKAGGHHRSRDAAAKVRAAVSIARAPHPPRDQQQGNPQVNLSIHQLSDQSLQSSETAVRLSPPQVFVSNVKSEMRTTTPLQKAAKSSQEQELTGTPPPITAALLSEVLDASCSTKHRSPSSALHMSTIVSVEDLDEIVAVDTSVPSPPSTLPAATRFTRKSLDAKRAATPVAVSSTGEFVEDLEDDDGYEGSFSGVVASPVVVPKTRTTSISANFWDVLDDRNEAKRREQQQEGPKKSLREAIASALQSKQQHQEQAPSGSGQRAEGHPETSVVAFAESDEEGEEEQEEDEAIYVSASGVGDSAVEHNNGDVRPIAAFGTLERRSAVTAHADAPPLRTLFQLSQRTPSSRSFRKRQRMVSISSPSPSNLLPRQIPAVPPAEDVDQETIYMIPASPAVVVPAMTAEQLEEQRALQEEIAARTRDATIRILRDFVRRWTESVAVTIVVILFLFYPTLLLVATQMLGCSAFDYGNGVTKQFLIADRSIDCSEPRYSVFYLAGYAALGLYGLGIPLASIGLVKLIAYMHDGDSDHARKLFFFTTGGFKEELWYWDTVALVRKAVLVVVTSLIAPDLAGLLCAWAMAGFLALNLISNPWANPDLSRLENTSLATLTATFSLVLLLPHYTFETAPVMNTMIAIGILTVNCIAFAAFAMALKTEFVFAVKSIVSKFPSMIRFAEIIGAIDSLERMTERVKKLEEQVETERKLLRARHIRSTVLLRILQTEEAGAIEEELAWMKLDQDIRTVMPSKLADLQSAIQREVADEMKLIDKKIGHIGISMRRESGLEQGFGRADSFCSNGSGDDERQLLRRSGSLRRGGGDVGMLSLDSSLNASSSKLVGSAPSSGASLRRLKDLPALVAARSAEMFRKIVTHMLNPKNVTSQLPLKVQIAQAKVTLMRTTFAMQVEIEELTSRKTGAGEDPTDEQHAENATDALEHLFETEVDIARKLLMSFRLRHALEKARRQIVLFM
jgi:hypothetical protein